MDRVVRACGITGAASRAQGRRLLVEPGRPYEPWRGAFLGSEQIAAAESSAREYGGRDQERAALRGKLGRVMRWNRGDRARIGATSVSKSFAKSGALPADNTFAMRYDGAVGMTPPDLALMVMLDAAVLVGFRASRPELDRIHRAGTSAPRAHSASRADPDREKGFSRKETKQGARRAKEPTERSRYQNRGEKDGDKLKSRPIALLRGKRFHGKYILDKKHMRGIGETFQGALFVSKAESGFEKLGAFRISPAHGSPGRDSDRIENRIKLEV